MKKLILMLSLFVCTASADYSASEWTLEGDNTRAQAWGLDGTSLISFGAVIKESEESSREIFVGIFEDGYGLEDADVHVKNMLLYGSEGDIGGWEDHTGTAIKGGFIIRGTVSAILMKHIMETKILKVRMTFYDGKTLELAYVTKGLKEILVNVKQKDTK